MDTIDLQALLLGGLSALIGGLFTLAGVFIANFLNNKNKANQDNEDTLRMLNTLRMEIQTLWTLYMQKIGPLVESASDKEPLLFQWPLTQNYFVFYEASVVKLGGIKDQDLSEHIVETYAFMKSMVDSYRMNNQLVAQYELAAKTYHKSMAEDDKTHMDACYVRLVNYAEALVSSHYSCKKKVAELLGLLEVANAITPPVSEVFMLSPALMRRVNNGVD